MQFNAVPDVAGCEDYHGNEIKAGTHVLHFRGNPEPSTEQGIYMLMTVLKGTLATQQSKSLIRVFKTMRDYLADNAMVFRRLDRIELKQIEADEKFRQIFKQLEAPKQNTRFSPSWWLFLCHVTVQPVF